MFQIPEKTIKSDFAMPPVSAQNKRTKCELMTTTANEACPEDALLTTSLWADRGAHRQAHLRMASSGMEMTLWKAAALGGWSERPEGHEQNESDDKAPGGGSGDMTSACQSTGEMQPVHEGAQHGLDRAAPRRCQGR